MTESERIYGSLMEALNSPFSATLLALADWHEEQGQIDTVWGLRWLVQHGKEPVGDALAGHWYWSETEFHPGRSLPRGLFDRLRKHRLQTYAAGAYKGFLLSAHVRSVAFLRAGAELGKWKRECDAAGTPLFLCPRCKKGCDDLHISGCCVQCQQEGWRRF